MIKQYLKWHDIKIKIELECIRRLNIYIYLYPEVFKYMQKEDIYLIDIKLLKSLDRNYLTSLFIEITKL